MAKSSFWSHHFSMVDPTLNVDDFLSTVVDQLSEKSNFFDDLVAAGGGAELFIGFFMDRSNTGFMLPAGLQRRLAELHLDLDFDIYGPDDDIVAPIIEFAS